jgi:hypothetical protein
LTMSNWKDHLQSFVDDVISRVYLLPCKERTMLSVLRVISDVQSTLNRKEFPSNGCYYISLAQIIDHLMQTIDKKETAHQNEWVCTFWEMYDEQIHQHVSVEYLIVRQDPAQFSVCKYVVYPMEQQIHTFIQSVVKWARHTFDKVPDFIETVDLTTGNKQLYWLDQV